jgi:hypothetical protein
MEVSMGEMYTVEEDSILQSTKKKIGPTADYDAFDHDILVSINSTFATLFDVCGFGGEKPVRITGPEETWSSILDDTRLEWVKDYVFMKVKVAFDPPSNGTLLANYKQQIAELEWRIYTVLNDYYPDVH